MRLDAGWITDDKRKNFVRKSQAKKNRRKNNCARFKRDVQFLPDARPLEIKQLMNEMCFTTSNTKTISFNNLSNYRHQRSCGKVIFLQMFVFSGGWVGMMSLPVWSHVPFSGGMVRGGTVYPTPPPVPTSSGSHRSGRCASYYSAFLLPLLLLIILYKQPKTTKY